MSFCTLTLNLCCKLFWFLFLETWSNIFAFEIKQGFLSIDHRLGNNIIPKPSHLPSCRAWAMLKSQRLGAAAAILGMCCRCHMPRMFIFEQLWCSQLFVSGRRWPSWRKGFHMGWNHWVAVLMHCFFQLFWWVLVFAESKRRSLAIWTWITTVSLRRGVQVYMRCGVCSVPQRWCMILYDIKVFFWHVNSSFVQFWCHLTLALKGWGTGAKLASGSCTRQSVSLFETVSIWWMQKWQTCSNNVAM